MASSATTDSATPRTMPPKPPLPTSMVAWQNRPTFFSSGPLTSSLKLNQTAAVPPLGKSQTLIKVLSAGLNPVDYKLGELPLVTRLVLGSPSTPGIDYVGRVWATSLPEPAHIKAGDLVFGKTEAITPYGTLAGFTVINGVEGVVKVPDGVELDWFATMGVAGLTAYQSIVPDLEDQGEGSASGKSVFINGGSGGVGSFTVQIAKAIGCANIVVTCSGANVDLVKNLGATEVIDYRSVNVADALAKWVKEKNGGKKFDVAVDNAGADFGLYYRSHEFLKEGARYTFVAGRISLQGFTDVLKAVLWPSVLGGGQRSFGFFNLKTDKSEYERLGRWMTEGKVKVMIDSTFSMDQAPEAYKRLKTGRARGNIVVRVSEDGRGPGS